MRANKIHEAECLRHAQIWVCPHHSLSYEDFDKLREPYGNYGSYAFRRADKTNSCKRHGCRYIFEHGFEIWMPQFPFEDSMDSRIHIASVRYRCGPNHIWDSIRSTFTRANVDRALSLIQAPICDHLLLSDKRISDDFSANDLDMRDYVWSTRMGFLNYKSAQGKERCCLICQAMGVWTMWRFQVWVKPWATGNATIEIHVLLSRSVGSFRQRNGLSDGRDGFFDKIIYLFSPSSAERIYAERNLVNKHRRCHGLTEASVTKFRASWDETGSKVPLLFPEVVPNSGTKRPQAKKTQPEKIGHGQELAKLLPSWVV